MTKPVKIAIAGLGTVGSALAELIRRHGNELAVRTGRSIAISGVAARDRRKPRTVDLAGSRWFDDPADVRFLTTDELDGRLGVAELRRTAARRAAEGIDPSPPDFLHGDAALAVAVGDAARLQGLGISPGGSDIMRGRAAMPARTRSMPVPKVSSITCPNITG